MKVQRLLYKVTHMNDGYGSREERTTVVDKIEEAHLRSSEVTTSWIGKTMVFFKDEATYHAPALDIDGINVEVAPSSTKGNFHLYIDKPMPWSDYKKLLQVMTEVGIIEPGFYAKALKDGKTFLRVRDKKNDPKRPTVL